MEKNGETHHHSEPAPTPPSPLGRDGRQCRLCCCRGTPAIARTYCRAVSDIRVHRTLQRRDRFHHDPLERRASASLALIFALRMLGLFLVLPVFALEARKYPAATTGLIGLAMGIYGLTQGLLQLPFGAASDRLGRKRVMVFGLGLFAWAVPLPPLRPAWWWPGWPGDTGSGAISAAVTALLADQTRDAVRTKAMAIVGASIGLMFAVALVLSPCSTIGWD